MLHMPPESSKESLAVRVSNVAQSLQDNNLSVYQYIEYILGFSLAGTAFDQARQQLIYDSLSICQLFLAFSQTHVQVAWWAFTYIKNLLCRELVILTDPQRKLNFNAQNASLDFLEGSFMKEAAAIMAKDAPHLWKIVEALLDARQGDSEVSMTDIGGQEPLDDVVELGELGGDEEDGEDLEEDTPVKKTQRRALARKAALIMIKSVVVVSIFAHSTNQRCNYLQTIFGIFLHSSCTPEKVIEALSHAGISIALSTIHNAVNSLSEKASIVLKKSVRTLRTMLAYDNFDLKFKTAHPTVEYSSMFVSATSATAIPMYGVTEDNCDALKWSDVFWDTSPLNPSPSAHPLIFVQDEAALLREFIGEDTRIEDEIPLTRQQRRWAWHIRKILLDSYSVLKSRFKSNLGEPEEVLRIPLHKTTQIPCRAMRFKESTIDGNIQVVDDLHRQGGIGEPGQKDFVAGRDVDVSGWVLLMHGDLLTKERLDSVRSSRSIEDTPKSRFQHIIVVPGLFHYKMACADAFWRIWIRPKQGQKDDSSLMEHIGVLRPDDTGKFASSSFPGFRMVHDVIHHDLTASILDCWRLEIKHRYQKDMSLADFVASEPVWEDIVSMSVNIVQKYAATTERISKMRDGKPTGRDQRFENQILRNRDELLYVDMSYSMNAGDIGAVEASFTPWIYLFKATGKHKYATHMLNFMKDLKDRFPQELSHIIRMNWLINPTGKPNAFRAVDWLVELNNLYTKVIHAGRSSNRTIDHIIKESPLIALYRDCHIAIENGFYLLHRTIHHASPNMKRTLDQLARKILAAQPHEFSAGRRVSYSVPDHISRALDILSTGIHTKSQNKEDDSLQELEAGDFAV